MNNGLLGLPPGGRTRILDPRLLTSFGPANVFNFNCAVPIDGLEVGHAYCFIAHQASAGAAVANIDGTGQFAIQVRGGALGGTEIPANVPIVLIWGGTAFELINNTTIASAFNALTNVSNAWSVAQYFAEATLTDAGPTAWNLSTQQNAKWTLGASRTLSTPTNMVAGQTGNLEIRQDATGSRIITWPNSTIFKWPGGTVPTLSTAANAVDLLSYKCRAADMLVSLQKGFA